MRTLATKLTIWYISAFTGILAISFVAMYYGIDGIFSYRIDQDLIEDIEEFRTYYDEGGVEQVKLEIQREVQLGDLSREFIRLLSSDGEPIFSSDMSAYLSPPVEFGSLEKVLHGEEQLQTVHRTTMEGEEADEYTFREITGILGDGLILHLGESTDEKQEIMETLLYSFVIVLLVVLPFAGFLGWIVAKNAVKGVIEVSHVASRIHKGQLDERVTIQPDEKEIADLASTFNSMLDRIMTLVSEMRDMIDNIAHDLKSPLARIRIISEETLSKTDTSTEQAQAANDTIDECDRLMKMINDSLDVTEAEVGIGVQGKDKIDLSALVSDACELFRPVAEQKNISLVSGVEPGCTIMGVEHVLQRTVANLLDNAIKYTDDGGEVALAMNYQGDEISITVSDTGIGISQSDQKKIFNRFYRCDNSRAREGCGLGLNYTRAVARALGGDVSLTSHIDRGSSFTLNLPANPAV